MAPSKKHVKTIDEYIKTFPADVQRVLHKVRQTIRRAAPGAEETISYQIPTFRLHGRNLVYFAGWKSHVSVYPIPSGNAAFKKEISPYKKGRGTLQFPLEGPIPYDLVRKVIMMHVKESRARTR